MDEKTSTTIGAQWIIAGGEPSVQVQVVLSAVGVVLSTVPGIGPVATLTLGVDAAQKLGSILLEKGEAAARKAGIVSETKLAHEREDTGS